MQDRQVHLQYLTEEHLGKFHNPNVTAKNRVNGSKIKVFQEPKPLKNLNLMPLRHGFSVTGSFL